MTSTSCWCFDERAAHRPDPLPVALAEHRPPTDGWPLLFAAVLDALLPFREAYAAAVHVAEEILHQLPGHPPPRPG